MEAVSLTVLTRRGVTLNEVQVFDVDDIASPITEVTPGGHASFFLRILKKGPFSNHNTGTGLTEYVVSNTLASIVIAAGNVFSANVLTYKGRTRVGSPLMGFNFQLVSGSIIPWLGGSKFYYQEDSDPDLVEYTCSQTPAAILAQITSNLIPPVATVPVGKTIFVDRTTGSDVTGLRERFDKMFASVDAAQAVAVSGDTIIVYPGTYQPRIELGVDGVNWELKSGAIFDLTTKGFNDLGVDLTFKISGYGKIIGGISAILMSGAASSITVEDINMSVGFAGAVVRMTNGTLYLKNVRVENTTDDPAANGINKLGGTLVLDDVVIVLTGAAAESIHVVAAQDIKIYSFVANRDVTPALVTNLISGTVLYFDTNVQ